MRNRERAIEKTAQRLATLLDHVIERDSEDPKLWRQYQQDAGHPEATASADIVDVLADMISDVEECRRVSGPSRRRERMQNAGQYFDGALAAFANTGTDIPAFLPASRRIDAKAWPACGSYPGGDACCARHGTNRASMLTDNADLLFALVDEINAARELAQIEHTDARFAAAVRKLCSASERVGALFARVR